MRLAGACLALALPFTVISQPLAFYYGDPEVLERDAITLQGSDGNYFLMGNRYSFVDTAGALPTNIDLEAWKISPEGEAIWYWLADSSSFDGVVDAVAEADGGLTILARHCGQEQGGVGCAQQNARLYRLDGEGNLVGYGEYYAGFIAPAAGLIKTGDGGYAITGFTTKYNANGDLYLLKLDAAGEEEWEALIPTLGGRSFDLAPAPGGGYLVAGSSVESNGRTALVAKVDETGEMEWTRYYGKASFTGKLIQPLGDGFGLLLTQGQSDFLPIELMVMDAEGEVAWEKDLAGDLTRPTGAVPASDGIVISGVQETTDKVARVIKYDLDGNLAWTKDHDLFPGIYEHPTDMAPAGEGYVIGGFTEESDTVAYVYPLDLMLFFVDEQGDLDSVEVIDDIRPVAAGEGWNIFPNPATEFAFFQAGNPSGTYAIRLYSAIGALAGEWKYTGPSHRIDLAAIPAGIYFYEARNVKTGVAEKGKLVVR
jgi:hypothetical protein